MNNPSDAMRLSFYLNREQYGERPLLRGPNFNADFIKTETTDRYGRVLARSAPLPVDADEVELRIPAPAVPPGTSRTYLTRRREAIVASENGTAWIHRSIEPWPE